MNNRNKALIITGVIIVTLAFALLMVGGWLAGWDFAAYFRSPSFIWLCVLVGVYALTVAAVLIRDWLDNKL